MGMMATIPTGKMWAAGPAAWFEDPLDEDEGADRLVPTTRRGLIRLALVAAETGARFQREAVGDPMAWLLAPRRLFGGGSAIEACLDRRPLIRALLLHGLQLGLDADPREIDALVDDGPDAPAPATCGSDAVGTPPEPDALPAAGGPRLFTATVVSNDGFETVHAFHASLAVEEAEIAGRLYCRMGAAAAGAVIQPGFDPTDPLVAALVSDAVCDTLALIASEPGSPLAAGLDLNVEQRFLA